MTVRGVFLLLARGKLLKLMDFLSRIYDEHQHHKQSWSIFDAFIKNLNIYLNTVFVLYTFTYIGCLCAPFVYAVVMYVVYDERTLFVMPIVIPGTTFDDHYVANLMFQVFACNVSVGIYMYFDAVFVLQLVHVILMANIVRQRIRVTEQMLMAEREASFRSIIHWQNELRE